MNTATTAPGGAGTARPCAHPGAAGPCGADPAGRYLPGWRCPDHTPAALAGRPEPGATRSCPAAACYCGQCPPRRPDARAGTPARRDDDPGNTKKAPAGLIIERAALAYMRRGWPVFILGRSKRPVANCRACDTAGAAHDRAGCGCLTCHGFYAATTDPARLAAMLRAVPGGLLAIRTGLAAGLVVVDIDPRNGGTVWTPR